MRTTRIVELVAVLGGVALGATALSPLSPAAAGPHGREAVSCSATNVRLEGAEQSVPANLCSPAASTDDTSTLLVWNKPEGPSKQVVDYRVYQDGHLLGTSSANARLHAPSQEYVDAFYARDEDGFHVRTVNHSFKVTGLRPATTYGFSVRALYADGTTSEASATIRQMTSRTAHRVVVTSPAYRAIGDGQTLNTRAIQKAIDTCRTPGCTVVVPPGTFKTGALFLHTDMTLELQQGARLLGSEHWQDYPLGRGYYLYPIPSPVPDEDSYTAYLRPPSLINVLPDDHGRAAAGRDPGDAARNVRIVGPGTVDGNGWKRTSTGSITDEAGNSLPQYIGSSADAVAEDGVLAANQIQHALETRDSLPGIVNRPDDITDDALYGQYRSSLMTFIGVENLYVEGITADNPAFHGLMFLDSANVGVYGTRHTTYNSNNGDGLEFGGTENAIVANNFFDTGDDEINFAAGQGKYGAQGRTTRDVWMFGNYLRQGHGGVAIGSHTAAWVEHLLAEDNVMYRTEIGGLRMKSTSDMAGGARHVLFRDTAMGCLGTSAFIATLKYATASAGYVGADSATFTDIDVHNVSVDGNNSKECGMADNNNNPVIDIQAGPGAGQDTATLSDFVLDHVRFRNVNPTRIQGLVDSRFDTVCFASVLDEQNPWKLDEFSTGNTFVNCSPMPGAGAPTGVCPK